MQEVSVVQAASRGFPALCKSHTAHILLIWLDRQAFSQSRLSESHLHGLL